MRACARAAFVCGGWLPRYFNCGCASEKNHYTPFIYKPSPKSILFISDTERAGSVDCVLAPFIYKPSPKSILFISDTGRCSSVGCV